MDIVHAVATPEDRTVTGIRRRVAVCDRRPDVLASIAGMLAEVGVEVVSVSRSVQLEAAAPESLSVIVLGSELDCDRDALTGRLRSRVRVPILMLIDDEDERSIVAALRAGADAVIPGPLRRGELHARLGALMRSHGDGRASAPEPLAGLQVRPDSQAVIVGGRRVDLTPIETALLCVLADHADRVIDHRTLWRAAWPARLEPDRELLRTHLRHLRRKLAAAGHPGLRNERGFGYALCVPRPTGIDHHPAPVPMSSD